MSWMTNRLVIRLRSVGRILKINRLLDYFFTSRNYEDRFKSILLEACREGDCVWDIGANIGYYSNLFSEKVGPNGCVYAFEPSPTNREKFITHHIMADNVVLMAYALGDRQANVMLRQGADFIGATSSIVDSKTTKDGQVISVKMIRGDTLIFSEEVRSPNVIKIDVEGYELEVLRGFGQTLLINRELRLLGIEVHFGILTSRGIPKVPAVIESMLNETGFECCWCDASHLVARRG